MAHRNPSESQEHANLIRLMVNHFQRVGCWDIRADLPGYAQPEVIRGTIQDHLPDVTCRRNDGRGTFIILEAETGSTVSDGHTASQWTLFADAAHQQGGEFHVVVPKLINGTAGSAVAQQRARQLGIVLHEAWTPT
jgi:hypothetical protein